VRSQTENLLPGGQPRTLATPGTELLYNIPVALHGVWYEVPPPSRPAQTPAPPGTKLLYNIPVTLHGVGYEVPLPGVPGHRHQLPQAPNYSIIYLSHCTESDMKYRSPVGRHTDTGSPKQRLTANRRPKAKKNPFCTFVQKSRDTVPLTDKIQK
jgi:hypothetical protein